jgi:uncharacterized protein YndB with AHSA1/START domain
MSAQIHRADSAIPVLGEITRHAGRISIRFERKLDTDLTDAWSVVSEPARIARWYAPVSVEGRRWITYWDGEKQHAGGEILHCEPESLLEVSWRASDDADPSGPESTVRITLTEDELHGGVLLVLEHEGLAEGDVGAYGAGWQVFLDRLCGAGPLEDWTTRFETLKQQYAQMLSLTPK